MESLEPELDAMGYDIQDPYAPAAKFIDQRRKEKAAQLRNAQRLEAMADKVEESKEPIKKWLRIFKVVVAMSFVIAAGFANGLFSGEANVISTTIKQELISSKNLIATLEEIWVYLAVFAAFIVLRMYNNKMD